MTAEIVPNRLAELEFVIERGIATFVEVGEALMEIRDSRLYRETHATFEAYCRERWGMTPRRAGQLIQATTIVGALAAWSQDIGTDYDGSRPTGTTVPINEGQARELAPLREQPTVLAEVWRDVREVAEREEQPITAPLVRSVVRARMRDMAAESEAELQAATAHWTDEQRAAVTPERLRAEGELMRLVDDLAALPEPQSFARDHRDMPWRVIAQADQALTWLTDFLGEWRRTHAS